MMTSSSKSPSKHTIFLTTIIFSILTTNAFSNCLLSPEIELRLRTDSDAIRAASTDYGNLVLRNPHAVLFPTSENDIIELIRLSNRCPTPFSIAARGLGHSVRGQAAARGGVVVDMASLGRNNGSRIRVSRDDELGYWYADVGGEQLWIDVLRAGLELGLAPVSWTDYLYLSVGGTLSNGGISGQSSFYGPQIMNVLQLAVITGKGDLITCSRNMNPELFFAVLGGLGQFGIITSARIILHKAPSRAKWVRLIYNDFSRFTRDQEHLIMSSSSDDDEMGSKMKGPDYVEGSVMTDKSPPNNWRSSSFYSPSQLIKIHALIEANAGILYSIELVKYYYNTADTAVVDQEVELMVKDLGFVGGFVFKKDVPLIEFLNRVGSMEEKEEEEEKNSHPWLNLFVPKSRIMDFNAAVFLNIIRTHNQTSGPILFYPLRAQKYYSAFPLPGRKLISRIYK